MVSLLVWGNIDKYKTIFHKTQECANKQIHKYSDTAYLAEYIKMQNTHTPSVLINPPLDPSLRNLEPMGFKRYNTTKKGFLENFANQPFCCKSTTEQNPPICNTTEY